MPFPEIVKIKQLESDIQEYAQKYYNDGSSPVSDEEFDAMVDELRKLHPNSRVLSKVGWVVNKDILKVAEAVWENGGGELDIPSRTDLPLPNRV